MSFDNVFDVAGGIVIVALATTIVSNRNSARVVNAIGNAFSNSIKASLG
jgi:hypothetical protein